jgi:ribonuclease J
VVGLFASNVQRLTLLGAIAQRTGRKICLLGRSMWTHLEVAREVGRIHWPSDLVVDADIAQSMPREKVLALATGTQAEERAAMSRLALGTHPRMRLAPDDTVIFSSRTIPGNDRQVVGMMGDFLRSGVRVISRFSHPAIHASGHAHRDEQQHMMELTRPRSFLPVHGTRHHLERHAELAREVGIDDVLVVEDGEVVRVRESAPIDTVGRTPTGRVAVAEREEIHVAVLAERQKLGRQGALSVAVVIDAGGRIVGRPAVRAVGVLAAFDADVLELAARAVERALGSADERTRRVDDALSEVTRLAARRCVEAEVHVRPTVLVHLVRV